MAGSSDLPVYESIFPKLGRALDHIEALDHESRAWLSSDAYAIVQQPEPDTGGYVVRVKLSEDPPTRLSLLFGDAIHNLRATLDHIAFFLATRNHEIVHGQPMSEQDARQSEFPIFGNVNSRGESANGEDLFNSAVAKYRWIEQGAVDVIKRLQPYQRGPDFALDPLWIVNELDRLDKHREPHIAALAVYRGGLTITRSRIWWIHDLLAGNATVEDGTLLARYKVQTSPRSQFHMGFATDIALGEGPVGRDEPVVALLRRLCEHIRLKVLDPLGRFLL